MRRHLPQAAVFAALVAIATGCASLQVRSFSDRAATFNRYHTYRWADDRPRATGDPRLDSNPFFEDRLTSDADRELAARGYEKTAGTADLVLHYHANFSQRLDVAERDASYGLCNGCEPGSVYDAGTIMLDFVDPTTNTLVWRAWAEGSM